MRIPDEEKFRDKKVKEILDQCLENIQERRQRYERRRRWLLFGNDSEEPVRFNRLLSHTDLVSSFLFSPDSLKFSIMSKEAERGPLHEITDALSDYLRLEAAASEIIMQFSDALFWALCYDTMFLKLGWSDSRKQVLAKIIDPYSFAVFDESESSIDDQLAFCHMFVLPPDDAKRRMIRAGKGNRIKELTAAPSETKNEQYPEIYRAINISRMGGANLGGNVAGQVSIATAVPTDYRARIPAKYVPARELWVYDEKRHDYRSFLVIGDDIVVEDSLDVVEALKAQGKWRAHYATETNTFLPNEHPFVQITPISLPDFFWGQCHTERLIPLQEWSNMRLDQINDILARNVDPSRAAFGVTGLTEDKMAAFGSPHEFIFEQNPTAHIDEFKPDMPPDLFAEFNKIGELFLEQSGLTQTITGQGASGVRSREHARQLTTTGSGRIKKAAMGLEPSLSRTGELMLKLIMENDISHLSTATGMEFLPAQIEHHLSVHVDAHSHSPLFTDDTKDVAEKLVKQSAITKEDFLKLMNPPGVQGLIEHLRIMEAKKEQMMQQQAMMGKPSGANMPNTKAEDEANRSHHRKPAMV